MGGDSTEPKQEGKTPKKQQHHGHIFTVGSSVEVLTEEKDYGGVFFAATVIESSPSSKKGSKKRSSPSKKKLYVEYHNLLVDDGGSERLREYVDVSKVRPEPPAFEEERVDEGYEVGETVDALYNDGWWTGVVTQLVEGRRVVVTFQHPPDEREFEASELRPHVDWVDGAWIRPEKQQVVSVQPSDDGTDIHDPNSQNIPTNDPVNNLMNDPSEKTTPNKQKTSRRVSTSLMKSCCQSPEPRLSSLRRKKLKEGGGGGDVSGAKQKDQVDKTTTEVISDLMKEDQSSDDNPSLRQIIRKKRSKFDAAKPVVEKINSASTSSLKINSESLLAGKKSPAQDVGNKLAIKEPEFPVIIGLPIADELTSCASGQSRAKKTSDSVSKDTREHQLNNSTTPEMKDGKSLDIDSLNLSGWKGQRKRFSNNFKSPITENAQNGNVKLKLVKRYGDSHFVPEEVVIEMDALLPNQENTVHHNDKFTREDSSPAYKRRRETESSPSMATHDVSSDEEIILASLKTRSSRRGRSIKSQRISPQVQGDRDEASGEQTKENNGVFEAPCSESDNGPLANCIEEMESPPINDGKGLQNSEVNCIRKDDNHQRNGEVPQEDIGNKLANFRKQDSKLVNEVSIVPSEQGSLPFHKNVILWKTIEAMETFKRMPQRPHFKPLEKFPEHSRQGLAIGYMVTFTSVAEKTAKLTRNVPENITDVILQTLAELESHGFDVRVIRDRVNDFLALKEKQRDYLQEVEKLKSQILEHEGEKTRICTEIEETKKQIRELQQKLSIAELANAREDEEITFLHVKLQDTEEAVKNVESEFKALESSLL